ncbi:MAG TPA: transglutaminase family protein [Rhizobacter sp.]|nr:transglutaminase family protein [Rhizobacter sp.]
MNAPHVARTSAVAAEPRGKLFDIDCHLDYELTGATDFLFQIHAADGMGQQVLSESLAITPKLPVHVYEDPTVHHRFLRLRARTGPLGLHYRAKVRRWNEAAHEDAPEWPIADLPDDILHNLMPTRYCESDQLSRAALKLFGDLPRGHSRVKAISDWIHDNIDYEIGSTNATSTARNVFLQRAGVCRDFAHLGVTFCRALNIPARLVVGYARFEEPPPDFHAVFEAYLGGRWVMFDPTRLSPVEDLVRIAMGRDAKDVAFATIFGPARMTHLTPCIEAAD